jgi:hypothetical protein
MSTVTCLREAGHDAVHLRDEGLLKIEDSDILGDARSENRVVLTFDLEIFCGDPEIVIAGKRDPLIAEKSDFFARVPLQLSALGACSAPRSNIFHVKPKKTVLYRVIADQPSSHTTRRTGPTGAEQTRTKYYQRLLLCTVCQRPSNSLDRW